MATRAPQTTNPVDDSTKEQFKTVRHSHKKIRKPPPPASLLGPLEEIFHLLADFVRSKKSPSMSRSVARGLLTIYQDLKIVRVHAIVQCQFANNLKLRWVELKSQLEEVRNNKLQDCRFITSKTLTSMPDPSLKKVIPVLEETEKIQSTLQSFLSKHPRLQLSIPVALWQELQRMPENLVSFPEHLSKQLNECKTLLQRIVILYNQLGEAHRTLKSGPHITRHDCIEKTNDSSSNESTTCTTTKPCHDEKTTKHHRYP
jgi:hypothetical protein